MTTLLKNAWVYAPGGVIQGGFVAVDGPVITYVGAARPEGVFDCEKDMSGRLLLPGLVNAHTHAAMTLLRGVGTDLPLQRWLFDSVFPVEGRMTAADIRAGTALALLEMLACGTTSFSDMYFFPWEAAELVAECGIKANLCYPVQAFDPTDTYERMRAPASWSGFTMTGTMPPTAASGWRAAFTPSTPAIPTWRRGRRHGAAGTARGCTFISARRGASTTAAWRSTARHRQRG